MELQSTIQTISVAALPLIFAITVHEAAHGWVASKCGDRTALMLGRVSLNPAKHIDLFGTIILPLIMLIMGGFIFGWAKPVPVNYSKLNHPKRDAALVALAGPAANLLMAFFWGFVAKLGFMSLHNPSLLSGSAEFFVLAGKFGVMINIVLLVLNLLPIPPLDGSRIISLLLPRHINDVYENLERYGIWILLLLLITGLLQFVLIPPVYTLTDLINHLLGIGA